jgi:ketosteroid isomerase-like protein
VETTIANLAKQRSQAVVKGDTSFLRQILDKDFVYINISGETLNRDSYLEGLVSFKNDSTYWISQDIDRIRVKSMSNGDAAIISFRVLDKLMYEGMLYNNYCNSTFVYEKKGLDWKCLLGQTTKIESNQ